jgi:hypothetical protein
LERPAIEAWPVARPKVAPGITSGVTPSITAGVAATGVGVWTRTIPVYEAIELDAAITGRTIGAEEEGAISTAESLDITATASGQDQYRGE